MLERTGYWGRTLGHTEHRQQGSGEDYITRRFIYIRGIPLVFRLYKNG
jgi:hypothetical protein